MCSRPSSAMGSRRESLALCLSFFLSQNGTRLAHLYNMVFGGFSEMMQGRGLQKQGALCNSSSPNNS